MRHIALLFALATASAGVAAQPVYKCGSTYSQAPCAPNAQELKIHRAPADLSSIDGMRARWAAADAASEKRRAAQEAADDQRRQDAMTEQRATDEARRNRAAKIKSDMESQVAAATKQVADFGPVKTPSKEKMQRNETLCKKYIAAQMKDPESATFQNIRRDASARAEPGPGLDAWHAGIRYAFEVNARNGFGGYVGYRAGMCVFDLQEETLLFGKVF